MKPLSGKMPLEATAGREAGPAEVAPSFHEAFPIPARMYRQYLVEKILNSLDLPPEPFFLDIGCGTGEFLLKLARRGFRGKGVDIDPLSVQQAARKVAGLERVEVHLMDVMDLDGTFDLVFAFSVIEHVEDDAACFAKVRGLLSEGGHFLFSVPGKKGLFGDVDVAYGHVRRYEREELIADLARAGLEIERIWSWGLAVFSKIYRMFAREEHRAELSARTRIERTRQSGRAAPGASFIKALYPFYSRLFWIYKLQNLFLEKDFLNCNYLVLAKRNSAMPDTRDVC